MFIQFNNRSVISFFLHLTYLFFVPVSIIIISLNLQKDFHYEYTECDSLGGRWRVSVPKPSTCVGGAPNPPIRGKDCSKFLMKMNDLCIGSCINPELLDKNFSLIRELKSYRN